MIVKRAKIYFIMIMVVLATRSNNFAQGESCAAALNISPCARSYGMGASGVADASDPANAYFNPANNSFLKGIFITGFYSELVPDLASDVYIFSTGVGGGIEVLPGEDMTISVGGSLRFTRLDYGEWEAYDPHMEYLGTFSSSEHNISLTLAGGLTLQEILKAGIGFSVKPLWIDLASAAVTVEGDAGEADGVAFDLGLLLSADLFKEHGILLTPSIGISYLNLGSGIKFNNSDRDNPLPKNLRFGAGLSLSSCSLKGIDELLGVKTPLITFSSNFDIIDNRVKNAGARSNIYAGGCEVGFLQMLFLRAGYYRDKDGSIRDYTYGIGAGIKLKAVMARLDFANFPQSSELDRVNKFGLTAGISF